MATKQRRELSHPFFFSGYRRFWRRTAWTVFLAPDGQQRSAAAEPEARPGVYELAITKGRGRRVKTYVGESGNLKARHAQYAADGDHLQPLFDAALGDGCTIWRRWRYVGTKEAAVKWEARFLSAFDYAWNARLNVRKRSLHLQQRWCCFCVAAGVELVEAEYVSPAKLQQQGGQRSPQQWRRQQRSPRKQRQPPAAKQLQFVVSA